MKAVTWMLAIAGMVLAALTAVAFIWPTVLWDEPDGGDIGASIEREADGAFGLWGEQCVADSRVWLCSVETDVGSGPSAVYRLVVDSDDCWTAEGRIQPKTLSGCITTLDYLGF